MKTTKFTLLDLKKDIYNDMKKQQGYLEACSIKGSFWVSRFKRALKGGGAQ